MKNKVQILIVSILAIGLIACSGDSSTDSMSSKKPETALDHAAKHANSKYVCPMHSNIISDKPGTCSVCGMTLVKK